MWKLKAVGTVDPRVCRNNPVSLAQTQTNKKHEKTSSCLHSITSFFFMFFSAALPAFLLFSVNPFFVAANRRPSHVQYGSDKDINNYRNVRVSFSHSISSSRNDLSWFAQYTAGFSIGGKSIVVYLT
jgi:hypothetical protein